MQMPRHLAHRVLRFASRIGPVEKERLLAFSDGVIAIIITIMVLELKVPHGAGWATLAKLLPVFLSYVLSFIYVGDLLEQPSSHDAHRQQGQRRRAVGQHAPAVLAVADPVRHRLDGREPLRALPVAVYGVALLMPAIAYVILQTTIIKADGPGSLLATALGSDLKGKISPVLYMAGIGAGLRRSVDLVRALCGCRADVAGAGPAHREAVAMTDSPAIEAAARGAGLAVRGGFHVGAGDGVPALADGRAARTVMLLGNVGGSIWPAFSASPSCSDGEAHPLDRWTRRVVGDARGRLGRHRSIPFEGPPYWPFQRWAQRAEAVHPSPLGLLIHPDHGLWHAYRAALVFAEAIELPPRDERPSPCATCAEQARVYRRVRWAPSPAPATTWRLRGAHRVGGRQPIA